ncbi:Cadherin-7, partial [Acipenser ruthenus]
AVDRLTNRPVEPESEFVVKIQDINDNEPTFLDGPYTAGVPEMSPVGTSVVQVTATDADDPTYGNSARVVYSILQGQPYFSVEPKTGIIRTALPSMDREAKDQYLLVIQAKDMVGQMGGLSGTTSVTVTLTDVNDNPPRFARKSYQYNVPESLPVVSVVAKIKAADADVGPNAEMEYRIIDGDGLGMLRVSTDKETQEGVITLQKELDFETKASYTLRIEATNKNIDPQFLSLGPFSDTTNVKIIVEDVDEPPIFTSPVNRMVVSEAAKVGTIIGTVAAHDPDASNSLIRYSIDRNTDLERFFNIDATTGVISTAKQLDREMNAVHNITLLAMESQDPTQVGRGIAVISVLDINDNAPMFAIEYETFLCENADPGQVIQTISAVDKDEPPNGHRFYFALTPEAASNLNFTLRDNKVLVLLIVTMKRRKKEPLIFDEERDIRENIVRYDDEGGGEEDTEAFDMAALRNLNVIRDTKTRRDVTPEIQFFSRPSYKSIPDNVIFREFIWDRLKEADIDPSAPPYDSLQTYAFEGSGSVAESLSSLESLSTDSDQNYDYLSDWGPRFKKLADMYGNSEDSVFS